MLLVDVAVPIPLAGPLTYSLPEDMRPAALPGARVTCKVRGRNLIGVVLRHYDGTPPFPVSKLRPITSVVDQRPTVPTELLHFLQKLSSYYMAPIGEVVSLALPSLERSRAKSLYQEGLLPGNTKAVGRFLQFASPTENNNDTASNLRGVPARLLAHLRANGEAPVARLQDIFPSARSALRKLERLGLVRVFRKEAAPHSPRFDTVVQRDTPPRLNAEQQRAVDTITADLDDDGARAFLLDGVTGSGKTEVYLRAIARALHHRRGALVLVPEIALTPQLVSRFRARFGDSVAVLHSGLSSKARYDMWRALRDERVTVAIGARSAIFAPVPNLGLIIVDEEHDPSFKQEDKVRYQARDMALLRAHLANATCVLGSATASLESQYLTQINKLTRLPLPHRANSNAQLPVVQLIDMRRTQLHPEGGKLLSVPVVRAVRRTLEAGEQAILFLNRRGFAPSVLCESCGTLASCPHCAVSLTLHRGNPMTLRCHYCDYETTMWSRCHECHSPRLALVGTGTERLEEDLAQAFPTARVARLDRDIAPGIKSEAVIDRMRRHDADILVGTQLVTKGHDLPDVTLVAVLNADSSLSLPDFRAGERAFQLLVQVAGRAGRSKRPGLVLIQTRLPDHPVLRFALRQDVAGFVRHELRERLDANYPPGARLALIRLDGADERVTKNEAKRLSVAARQIIHQRSIQVEVLGPSPAPIERLRARYRYRLLLRSSSRQDLRCAARAVLVAIQDADRRVRVAVDIDPQNML